MADGLLVESDRRPRRHHLVTERFGSRKGRLREEAGPVGITRAE